MAQPQRGTRLAHVVRGRRHQEDAVDLNNDGLAEVSQLGRARQRARARRLARARPRAAGAARTGPDVSKAP